MAQGAAIAKESPRAAALQKSNATALHKEPSRWGLPQLPTNVAAHVANQVVNQVASHKAALGVSFGATPLGNTRRRTRSGTPAAAPT